MANTLSSLIVTLGLDAGDFQKGIDSADKSIGSFAARMQKIGGQMQKIGGAMTVGLTLPIAAFGASSVKSAMDAENALADLQAVLKSTGGAAGVTLDELTANASALQKVTKFSDEAVMSAQGMLLTFTNIGKDVFPSATAATLDMAEKFGMDASQAAITLGKALNDPIAGVTALRRIGVQLTDDQELQIKSFMAVGDMASAQKLIMKELAVEIGGVARAAGETTSGKFAQLINQLDDMKEEIGNALIPTLLNLANAVVPLIERFGALSPETQNTIIAIAGIVAAAGPLVTAVGGITSAIGTLTPVITGLFTFITATAIPAIATFIAASAAWIVPLALVAATVYLVYLAFKKNFGGIATTAKQLGFIIKYALAKIVDAFKNTFPAAAKWMVKLGEKVKEIIATIKEGFKGIGEWIKENNPLKNLEGGMKGGKSIIKLAVDASEATAAFEDVAQSAEDLQAKMKVVSDRNQTFISSLENYATFDKNYKDDHLKALEAIKKAEDDLYWVRENNAGKNPLLWQDELGEASRNLILAKQGLQELEASWHESTQRMVYDMIQTQFMADGVLAGIEADALVAFGLQSGLFTEEQAKYTQLLLDQANAFVIQTQQTEKLIGITGDLTNKVTSLGLAWMKVANNAGLASQFAMRGRGYTLPTGGNKAFGGSVLAGIAYNVGEHGQETFVPRTNGTIIPHGESAGGGNSQVFNVTVLNPKKETSEESVRKALKNLSYLGAMQ